jgi:hypothetical protein
MDPRPHRERLTDAITTGAIILHRLELPDTPVADPAAQDHLHRLPPRPERVLRVDGRSGRD